MLTSPRPSKLPRSSPSPTTGTTPPIDPGLLVFDSQLTTYKILDQLTALGINWLTLRQSAQGPLAASSTWHSVTGPLP